MNEIACDTERAFLIGLCSESGYCCNGDALSAFSSREELSIWFQDQNMISLLLWNAIEPGNVRDTLFRRIKIRWNHPGIPIEANNEPFSNLPSTTIDTLKSRRECQFGFSIDVNSTLSSTVILPEHVSFPDQSCQMGEWCGEGRGRSRWGKELPYSSVTISSWFRARRVSASMRSIAILSRMMVNTILSLLGEKFIAC